MNAIVVLADVKDSRRIDDREEWASRLGNTLKKLNRKFGIHIAGRFEPQKGVDEFGGVLHVGAPAGDVLLRLWYDLHPVQVRVSVVRGHLDVTPAETPNRRAGVSRFDGPAFHKAAADLARVEKEGGFLSLRLVEREDALLSAYGDLAYLHILRATPRQKELLLAYADVRSQAKVAGSHGITQPAVSEALAATNARILLPALDRLRTRLNDAAGGAHE